MGMPFLSILTLTNYNPNLWDNLDLPSVDITENGVTTTYSIDPDILIPEILFECSDLALIYPDSDYMEGMIGLWCGSNYDIWRRLLYTCVVPYNPLWNVDADITDNVSGNNSGTASGSTSGTTSGTTSGSTTETDSGNNSNTDTKSVTGYNSSSWMDHEKDTSSGSRSESKNGTMSGTTSESNTGTTSNTDSRNWSETHTTRRTGNIGVTSSQELIERERKVSEFSIYKYIVDSFKKRFCIMVY